MLLFMITYKLAQYQLALWTWGLIRGFIENNAEFEV